MQTIAVAMQKGGSGKTTTTVNLAAALAERKKRVLIVDVDPQANTTTWLGVREADKGIYAPLCENGSIDDIIIECGEGIDLAPSSQWLVGAERALSGEVGAEAILRRKLDALNGRYDIALIDTPPTIGVLTIGALVAADEVVIPVEAHVMALNGLAQITQTIDTVRERLNERLNLLGIVACRVDGRTRHAADVVEEVRARFKRQTFKTIIRENVRLAEAPSFGQSVLAYDTRSAGAEDYRSLAKEVIARLKRRKTA